MEKPNPKLLNPNQIDNLFTEILHEELPFSKWPTIHTSLQNIGNRLHALGQFDGYTSCLSALRQLRYITDHDYHRMLGIVKSSWPSGGLYWKITGTDKEGFKAERITVE